MVKCVQPYDNAGGKHQRSGAPIDLYMAIIVHIMIWKLWLNYIILALSETKLQCQRHQRSVEQN